jgi:hypothetical protein
MKLKLTFYLLFINMQILLQNIHLILHTMIILAIVDALINI